MKVFATVTLGLLLMTGCSSQPDQSSQKPQPKATNLLSGRPVFQQLYLAARGWAPDAQPIRLQSQVTPGDKDRDGKAAVWTGYFGSPMMRGVKFYTWSGTDAPDFPERGISPGGVDTYNPSNTSMAIFDVRFLKIDSDQAYAVAQKHGGDKVLGKNPDIPISYILDWNQGANKLNWHVIYGASRGDAKLVVDVDASTGTFGRVEK
ncbi:MAG: hypothetical protein ACRD2U_12895 [Terriglobales bacterium]